MATERKQRYQTVGLIEIYTSVSDYISIQSISVEINANLYVNLQKSLVNYMIFVIFVDLSVAALIMHRFRWQQSLVEMFTMINLID